MELAGELRLLKVFARASGACAFSRRWKWDQQAHAEAVDALVLSFSQFAREIDGGGAARVAGFGWAELVLGVVETWAGD